MEGCYIFFLWTASLSLLPAAVFKLAMRWINTASLCVVMDEACMHGVVVVVLLLCTS